MPDVAETSIKSAHSPPYPVALLPSDHHDSPCKHPPFYTMGSARF